MARKLNKLKLVLTIFIFLLIIIILSYFTLKVEDIIEISKEHSLSPRERINKRCYENVFIEKKIIVESWQKRAMGSPGHIIIGGYKKEESRGINDPWLLYHEVTHSFWGSHNSPIWFSEGSGTFIPNLIIMKIEKNPPDFWEFSHSNDMNKEYKKILKKTKEKNGDLNTPLINLEDYKNKSNRGRLFLNKIYLLIGEDNFSKMYKELYKIYTKTGEKIDEKNIEEAILLFE